MVLASDCHWCANSLSCIKARYLQRVLVWEAVVPLRCACRSLNPCMFKWEHSLRNPAHRQHRGIAFWWLTTTRMRPLPSRCCSKGWDTTSILHLVGTKAYRRPQRCVRTSCFSIWACPEWTGSTAAQRVRALAHGKEITLVALTGWGQEHDRQRTREAGFDGHLLKPIDPAVLEKLLAEPAPRGDS